MNSKWERKKISDLCDLIVDCVNKTAPTVPYVTPFKMIRTSNIKNGQIKINDCRFVEEETFEKWTRRANVLIGDLLLTREAPMGEVGYVNYTDQTFLGQRVMQYRANPDLLDSRFLLYSFLSTDLQFQFGRYNNGGSIVSHICVPDCFEFEISTPCLITQQKIASVLSALDDKIELNNRINAELEAMAKLLYEYWFVQFDFPYDLRQSKPADETSKPQDIKPYKSSGGKMVWNKDLNREIPKGWRNGTLSDISSLTRGVTYNKDDIQDGNSRGTIPILRATNITGNQIDLNSMVYVSESLADEDQILQPFDILITMSSGSIDHIGKNGFYLYNEEVAFGAFCAKIQAKGDFTFYLYSYTQSDFFFTTIKNECLGTNINNLNGSMVKGFKLVVPDQATLLNFNQIVKSMFDKIRVNTNLNQQLSSLRDWLLPMLMNGQISVMDAEERVSEELGMVAEGERGRYEKK
jgi:type I restriction enzyme S subunit